MCFKKKKKNCHSRSIESIEFGFALVPSVGLDECVMACVHHYSVIQNNVRALKILCATPFFFFFFFYPSLPPKPWQPLIFSVSPWFCHFQNVI